MKKINKLLVLFAFLSWISNAQTEENPWQITLGVNAVDVYPVGENSPQGPYFDEFFNLNDHWSILPSISTFSVSRYFKNNFSFTFRGSINRIDKWGQTDTNVSVRVDDLMYYGLDGSVKYSFADLIKSKRVEPFLSLGGGYTWIEEGKYNTFSLRRGANNNVGAGTLNGTLGLSYWFSDYIGITYSSTYKHTFKEYLTKHFQHTLGLAINFGGEVQEEEIEEIIPEIIPDSDGDGINDNLDRCPNVVGVASNNGCPPKPVEVDSDGDGLLDSVDNCPKVKGPASNKGCPLPDSDNDGIIDSADRCPTVPGIAENNGCPYDEVKVGDRDSKLNMLSKRILFDTSKTSFKQETYVILSEIAKIMKQHPEAEFKLEGHTDSVGDSNMNMKLSERRVKAVRDYLVSNGVSASALITEAFGESKPTASNATREGRKQNRRVEVIRIK